jgi:hypothetical protein
MKARLSLEDIIFRKPKGSKLTPISISECENGHNKTRILCECECGRVFTLTANSFLYRALSCGCVRSRKFLIISKVKHIKSLYPKKLRVAYKGMMERCYSENNISYHNYGGRGVRVCDEWKGNINVFCAWAVANGWSPRLQLDKDILGDGKLYSPESCCFVTSKINNRNRRDNIVVSYNGSNISVAELSDIVGIPYNRLYYAMEKYKMSLEESIEWYDSRKWADFVMGLSKIKAPEMETPHYKELINESKKIIKELIK